MKCIVLAGGAGNRLWPLSRKNYPKQFVNLKNGHSLFQETIARNMAFCDEFWVFTASAYRSIVEGQLQPVQDLRYRCFGEELSRKTAPALALAALCADPGEELLVVSTDNMIEGGYKAAIAAARQQAAKGHIVCLGVEPTDANPGYGLFRQRDDLTVEYHTPGDADEAEALAKEQGWLWDTGMVLARADVLLQEMEKHCPELLRAARSCMERLDLKARAAGEETYFRLTAAACRDLPALGFGPALTGVSACTRLLKAEFSFNRMVNLDSLVRYFHGEDQGDSVQQGCSDTVLLNLAQNRLVVAEGLENTVVVNTDDAVYVASAEKADQIKEIIRGQDTPYAEYFEEGNIYYAPWGIKETLARGAGYQIKKLTIYPGKQLSNHAHANHSEHWSVLSGVATVLLDGQKFTYGRGESVLIPAGQTHCLKNMDYDNLVLVETSIGDSVARGGDGDLQTVPERQTAAQPQAVKLMPAFKDYLWGGTQLKDRYGKESNLEITAESWELSAHEAGPSRLAENGCLFGEYLEALGRDAWGWKCRSMEKFPLLIKFIDAREKLSIQVHPDDDYALKNEDEYGKNEMWYILDCKPGAALYCGFDHEVSAEEVRARVADGTLPEVLNRVPVEKGQTLLIPAGTVHAVGEGILICEVQQSSNVTYRLYDYQRRDKNGALRPLHLEKALDVMSLAPAIDETPHPTEDGRGEVLCRCKYFTVERYAVDGELTLLGDDSSFTALVILEGEGTLGCEGQASLAYKAADTFFIPAGKTKMTVAGGGTLLRVNV